MGRVTRGIKPRVCFEKKNSFHPVYKQAVLSNRVERKEKTQWPKPIHLLRLISYEK